MGPELLVAGFSFNDLLQSIHQQPGLSTGEVLAELNQRRR